MLVEYWYLLYSTGKKSLIEHIDFSFYLSNNPNSIVNGL